MVEVVLIIVPTTSPNIKYILTDTGMMDGFIHIRSLAKHPMWNNIAVGVIWLVLWVVLHLMFDVFGNGGVGPMTTHLYLQKVYCWIDGGDFVSY